MSIIRITKLFHFETGHALYGYDGKCKNGANKYSIHASEGTSQEGYG